MINSEITALRSSLGNNGSILVTDTTEITGEFIGLFALTDSTFTILATPDCTKNGDTTAVVAADWGTITAGTFLPTRITACTRLTGLFMLIK